MLLNKLATLLLLSLAAPLSLSTHSASHSLTADADDSISLYLLKDNLGKDKESNWLAAFSAAFSRCFVCTGQRIRYFRYWMVLGTRQ